MRAEICDACPTDWQIKPISSVCSRVTSGGTPSRRNPAFFENGTIPWVKTQELTDEWIDDTDEHITEEAVQNSSAKLLPEQTLLLALYGATVGQLGILRRAMTCNQACCAMIADPGKADFRYLYYQLLHARPLLKNLAVGAAQQNLSGVLMKSLELPFPHPAEQRAIAGVLGALDDKIELNRRMNETLEAIAKAEFRRMKEDGEPCTLGDIAENTKRGVDPSDVDPQTPYIGLEHMPRRSIALSEWGTAGEVESGKARFQRGEILFGKLRPYFHKIGVAPLCGVCSTDILTIVPKKPAWFGIVLGHLSSKDLIDHADACSTGTKMPRGSWSDIARYEIALPPEPVAAKLTGVIQPLLERIIANIHESRTLAALRDALLPKLLSGVVRVKDAEKLSKETANA